MIRHTGKGLAVLASLMASGCILGDDTFYKEEVSRHAETATAVLQGSPAHAAPQEAVTRDWRKGWSVARGTVIVCSEPVSFEVEIAVSQRRVKVYDLAALRGWGEKDKDFASRIEAMVAAAEAFCAQATTSEGE